MNGSLRILSVGHGDLTIKCDGGNPAERKRAAEIIKDLIRKGYAVMVQVGSNERGPIYQRAKDFDPNTSEYVVMGDAPKALESEPVRRRGRPMNRVPSSAPAIAVARSAGGYDPNIADRIRRGASLREGL